MTVNETLIASGIKFTRRDASKIGHSIQNKAREQKVKWQKKEEVIAVNDFPETFSDEMQQIVAQYFTSKTKS